MKEIYLIEIEEEYVNDEGILKTNHFTPFSTDSYEKASKLFNQVKEYYANKSERFANKFEEDDIKLDLHTTFFAFKSSEFNLGIQITNKEVIEEQIEISQDEIEKIINKYI